MAQSEIARFIMDIMKSPLATSIIGAVLGAVLAYIVACKVQGVKHEKDLKLLREKHKKEQLYNLQIDRYRELITLLWSPIAKLLRRISCWNTTGNILH